MPAPGEAVPAEELTMKRLAHGVGWLLTPNLATQTNGALQIAEHVWPLILADRQAMLQRIAKTVCEGCRKGLEHGTTAFGYRVHPGWGFCSAERILALDDPGTRRPG